MKRRFHVYLKACLVSITISLCMASVGARAGDIRETGGNEQRGVFNVGASFTGGPFFLMGIYAEWLGIQIDIEPRLAVVEGEKITRHIRIRASNEVVFHNIVSERDRFLPAYRPSIGIKISDERSNSAVLPFFTARGGVQLWPSRTPVSAGGDGEIHTEVTPYIPIGGGIEFPKNSPVMAHIELEAVFPEALWFLFPQEYFGWLPIHFELGVVIQL